MIEVNLKECTRAFHEPLALCDKSEELSQLCCMSEISKVESVDLSKAHLRHVII